MVVATQEPSRVGRQWVTDSVLTDLLPQLRNGSAVGGALGSTIGQRFGMLGMTALGGGGERLGRMAGQKLDNRLNGPTPIQPHYGVNNPAPIQQRSSIGHNVR